MSLTAAVLYFLVAVIYLVVSFKRVSKQERLIFFRDGKPKSVAGPGIVLALPGIQQTRRLKVTPNTSPLPALRFNGRALLVTGTFIWKISDPLKAANLSNVETRIEQELESTFGTTLLNATLRDCLCDSFTLTNVAEDLLNERTRLFGVRISDLKCTDFPAHRQVVAQLIALIGKPICDLEVLAEQIGEQNGLQGF
jgi:regulator of protease activity HflC (stomatin/prohibitin superfamily)